MSYITYKQYDSRWGSKNYNGSSTMATAGCGPTSVANLAFAVDGKVTPIDTMKFMQKHGYAVYNNGTAWSGIPACMAEFGLVNVQKVDVSSTMEKVWDFLSKGYCAVFLFSAGSRGGICWTTSGHYVAVTNYKLKNKKHYLYTRDSGGRDHDGWYCYETQMKGLIPQVWVGVVPIYKNSKKKKFKGTLPTSTVSKNKGTKTDIERWQNFLSWWLEKPNLSVDGVFGEQTHKRTTKFQKAYELKVDGSVGYNTRAKAKEVAKGEKH